MKYFMLVTLILLTAGSPLRVQADGRTLVIQDLALAARANYENIKSLDVSWTEKQEPGDNPTSDLIPLMKMRLVQDFVGNRYRVDRSLIRPDIAVPVTEVEAYNGKLKTSYSMPNSHGYVKEMAASDFEYGSEVLVRGMMYKPEPNGNGLSNPSIVDYLAHSKLRPEQEVIDGHSCYVVDYFNGNIATSKMWIDLDRGALPLKRVIFQSPDSKGMEHNIVDSILEAHEFKDDSGNAVWLPTRMKSVSPLGTSTVEVDVTNTHVNPKIDPELFKVEFPRGAAIFDTASKTLLVKDPADPSMHDTQKTTIQPPPAKD